MNKNDKKLNKKLTPKDYERMWGEDGPYSQVNLIEQTRILDNRVSRIFLVVEAEINPFTFEYIEKHRRRFEHDEAILQLLDHAEYSGDFGYIVSAGEVELSDEESRRFARKQADMTTQTLIRMHKFVIEECGLEKGNKLEIIKDGGHPVWNEETGIAEVDSGLFANETFIGSPAGIKNNGIRFFIILAFDKGFNFKSDSARAFAKILKSVSKRFNAEIESVDTFIEYALITALLPFDIAPARFIESVLNKCMVEKKPIFQKDYFVSNVKKPTQEQILSFLKKLPLDKDIRMDS